MKTLNQETAVGIALSKAVATEILCVTEQYRPAAGIDNDYTKPRKTIVTAFASLSIVGRLSSYPYVRLTAKQDKRYTKA